MSLQIYDTMTRRKTAFVPRTPGEVSMYVCGPTVYDVPHLGHGRTALTYDVIRRYFEWSGFDVTLASNVTDIDDKIVGRAQRERRSEAEVAAEYTAAYDAQMERLGVLAAHSRPHATHFIAQMIDVIAELLSLGAAYEVPGKGVYFCVDAAPATAAWRAGRSSSSTRTLVPASTSIPTSARRSTSRSGRPHSRASRAGTRRGARAGPAGTPSASRCRAARSAWASTSTAGETT